MPNETVVTLVPRERVMLNEALIKEKGISAETAEKIIEIHGLMDSVLDYPEEYDEGAVSLVEQYEYWLQELWGFPQDRNYHIHWVRIKGCTCPKMDNRDLAGSGRRITVNSCLWHGE